MDYSDIRDRLKTRLVTISGLRVYATVPDKPEMPAAIIRPLRLDYQQSMGGALGANRVPFEIILLTPLSASNERSQATLDAYLDNSGTYSLKAAIEGDKTLGGTVHTLHVSGWRDYGPIEWVGITYLGVRVDVEVWD
jgi:hypothetical protein